MIQPSTKKRKGQSEIDCPSTILAPFAPTVKIGSSAFVSSSYLMTVKPLTNEG